MSRSDSAENIIKASIHSFLQLIDHYKKQIVYVKKVIKQDAITKREQI